MSYRVVALPGDGIGPEVMAEGLKVLEAVRSALGLALDVLTIPCGGRYYLQDGQRDWPDGSEERCAAADAILLGAVGWPREDGQGPVSFPDGRMAGHSAVLGNRTRLDLYANVRPVRLYPGVRASIHGCRIEVWDPARVDLVIVRENTEGLYAIPGGTLAPGGTKRVAVDPRVITRDGSERVIRRAFQIASQRSGAPIDKRSRVTCVLKDNVLEGCRLFRDVFHEVGQEFPSIERDTALIDSFALALISQPERFDVCVTTNLFGDILTDLAAVLQGGLGLAVGANLGDGRGLFEPIHGSAPSLAGQGRANPLAMILAVAEMLSWLGAERQDKRLRRGAAAIETACREVLSRGAPLTADLVGATAAATTTVVGDAIVERVRDALRRE